MKEAVLQKTEGISNTILICCSHNYRYLTKILTL